MGNVSAVAKRNGKPTNTEIARAIGISVVSVGRILKRTRNVSLDTALAWERAGYVARAELLPMSERTKDALKALRSAMRAGSRSAA